MSKLSKEKQKVRNKIRNIAYEEVCKLQESRYVLDERGRTSRIAKKNHGKFSKAEVRKIRQNTIQRFLADKKNEERYGFITIGWVLMIAIGSAIAFAITRWLKKLFPERDHKADLAKYEKMLEEIAKE